MSVFALDSKPEKSKGGRPRIGIKFVDSSSGRIEHGFLLVSEQKFTAPTFAYRLENGRALTSEKVRTGRPNLELRIPSYERTYPPKTTIMLAHFATFAEGK